MSFFDMPTSTLFILAVERVTKQLVCTSAVTMTNIYNNFFMSCILYRILLALGIRRRSQVRTKDAIVVDVPINTNLPKAPIHRLSVAY